MKKNEILENIEIKEPVTLWEKFWSKLGINEVKVTLKPEPTFEEILEQQKRFCIDNSAYLTQFEFGRMTYIYVYKPDGTWCVQDKETFFEKVFSNIENK